jgi:hypothetical protein
VGVCERCEKERELLGEVAVYILVVGGLGWLLAAWWWCVLLPALLALLPASSSPSSSSVS